MAKTQLGIRIDDTDKAQLAQLAVADRRTTSSLVVKILKDWLRDRTINYNAGKQLNGQ